MKNKSILMLSLCVLTFATHNMQARDNSWFEYFVSIFWNTNKDAEQPKLEPSLRQGAQPSHKATADITGGQAGQQNMPKPSAPPLEQPQQYNAKAPTAKSAGITNAEYNTVRYQIESIIDGLFATKEQEHATQLEIQAIKDKTLHCIGERIRNIATLPEFRQAANHYLTEYLTKTIAYNARLLYQQKANKLAVQLVQSQPLAEHLEKEIKTHALKAINLNEPGVLAFFVGKALDERVAAQIKRDFAPILRQAQDERQVNKASKQPQSIVQHPKPSAPPAEHHTAMRPEIYEVYVHSNAARYEESIARIQQGKAFRDEPECVMCFEEFGGSRKRVTLVCGHTICPACLQLHLQKNDTCPTCAEPIAPDEFPAAYLHKYNN
ncbi:MAG: RING finger protein [Candidatus Babeliales bacterium]